MQYVKELRRLFMHPKKYPMYRITKLRYIFLHILVLSFILILPSSTHYFQITQSLSALVHHEVNEIPKFTIDQNQMKLSQEKIIHLDNEQAIVFTKSNHFNMENNHLIVFKPDHIEISDYNKHTELSYGSISTIVTNEQDLSSFIDTINSSKYFYLAIILLLLLFIQMVSLSLKIGIVALIAHIISRTLNKKTRFMTWLKASTFIITLPTLVLLLGIVVSNTLLIIVSWCIIIVGIIATAYYLPNGKKHANLKS